jgi:opacity protein-like surface antigen
VIRRLFTAVAVAAVLAVAAPAARAMTWTIGPNLDLSTRDNDGGGGNITSIGLPGTIGGLRVGFPLRRENASLFFDTGLAATSGGDARTNHWSLSANMQWAFTPRSNLTPYVNGGFGFRYVSFHTSDEASATSLAYGLGLGLRQRWGESASVRGEVRFDRLTEGSDGDITVTPGGREYSLRLGFDLWVK